MLLAICNIFKLIQHSEVCYLRCVFKLYGEVNSVENTTTNIWLNDGDLLAMEKLYVSGYSG